MLAPAHLLAAELEDLERLARFEQIKIPARRRLENDGQYKYRFVNLILRTWKRRGKSSAGHYE